MRACSIGPSVEGMAKWSRISAGAAHPGSGQVVRESM
jgi:hypothetical protein